MKWLCHARRERARHSAGGRRLASTEARLLHEYREAH
jgi:hypothetical protein